MDKDNDHTIHLDKFKFSSPACVNVTGPSSSGKSEFIFQVIKYRRQMFTTPPVRVIYCYKVWQQRFQDLLDNDKNKHEILFNEGVYDISKLTDTTSHKLLILDDLMHSLDKSVSDIFCVKSHHNNISCFYINQNLYGKSPFARDINLNSQYILIFKLRRDLTSLRILGGQLFPENPSVFMKVYNECTKQRYSYLLIDIHPNSHYRLSLRTNILPDEIESVYTPIN